MALTEFVHLKPENAERIRDLRAAIAPGQTNEQIVSMALELAAHCHAFIKEQGISCAETVYQTDHVIENAYEFIEGVCNIVGYDNSDD